MPKYEAVYFVGDNQAVNRVRVDSYKTRNRGTFSGSLAALLITHLLKMSKCELSLKVLQIANFSQINHSPTFGRAFTW